ncbi:MAG: SH3 domain-containing protein [Oscillochloridaceae bacterium]|nr:SH3 domain-containing protein [Chloroflexaceae bacterium]MDW8391420.1 SH3 domain-containing protein [Oscillochloridaceae bacterium]
MRDLLSQLDLPIIIGLIVLVLIILAVVVLFARRSRQMQTPAESQPPVSEPIDYTSLPIDEEPTSMAQRFASLSLAGKILVILVPILVLLGVLALVLTLLPGSEQTVAPTPVPVTLRVRDAAVIRADPPTIGITIETTGLANGAVVTAELLEDGSPFPWMNPEQAQATVRNNRAEMQVQRADDAPTPTEGRSYTVIARGPDGTASAPMELSIPSLAGIADAFFEKTAAEAPTTPPATPTSAPSPAPATTPTAVPTPTPELPTGPIATVGNGGNVRRQPIVLANNVVAGVNAGEEVQLLSRTPNGAWYRVRTVRDEIGWVSVTLLRIPQGVNVPVAPVVTVFVTGPVYERPDRASTELDRVNQGEVVELTRRTAAGDWYAIVNLRDVAGWAPAELLGIPPEVADAVPVEE